ncbi:MAG: RNA polymerase sigma factor [Blautia sp.]|nr:RNA polymerase sigma factor [Lachnoclostridium sp.]MCM1209980.1 RNA polymerase sigma factor [Blautia sp.]
MITLVEKAMNGDQDAFLELMECYRDTMLRIAYGYLSQEADIADVMQDTILDAYEHLSSLKEPRYFKTWLIRILLNNCNRIYRRNKKCVPIEELSESLTDAMQDIDLSLLKFRELLSFVSEENRICFQLYYGEELTTKEIADILHINENTIRSRMHREKARLRTQLQKSGYITANGKEGAL